MKYIVFLLLFCIGGLLQAQVLDQAKAQAELKRRGISEARFQEELQRRGIDLTKVNPSNTQELLSLENTLKSVLDDLETEARNQKFDQTDAKDVIKNKEKQISEIEDKAKASSEIKRAVDKGATLEEAISETLVENQKSEIPAAVTYGQQFFREGNLKLFRTTDDSKPSKSYILGPGDVVAISIFGTSSVNIAKEITKDGYIQPDKLPRYYLSGLTIEKAETLLKKSLRSYILFSPEEFQISVTTARTVNVNIFGEVIHNGSFNISAVNTAFNALVAAGGPTDIGSVRKIKLLRGGQTVKTLDVYNFLSNPSIAEDYYLQENDYVQVPVADKLVTIYGAVNRPFRYELLENENMSELIKYAGGLLPNAIHRNIQVTRVENDLTNIIDVNWMDLKNKNQDFILKNGDVIKIANLKEEVKNIVSIAGGVEEQGQYAFTDGMKITDLLTKAKLKETAIKNIAYLRRYSDDLASFRYEVVNVQDAVKSPFSSANIVLKRGDVLTVRSATDFVESKVVKIDGAIRIPGEYPLSDSSLNVSDLLFLSGGIQDKAADFGYVFRRIAGNEKSLEYKYIDLKAIKNNPKSDANLKLSPSDSIFVYYASDYIDKLYVTVDGAVRKSEKFLYNPTLTVKDAILMAGGLRLNAAPNRIDIYRVDYNNANKESTILAASLEVGSDGNLDNLSTYGLQPFDKIHVRYASEFELQKLVKLDGEIKYPGEYALLKDNTRIIDVIKMAGGITKEAYLDGATLFRVEDSLGYIVINLKNAMDKQSSLANVILQKGDIITIPKQNTIVSITGATNYDEVYPDKLSKTGKVNIAFDGSKDALYYINNYAGGLDKRADRNRISVEHRNGKVEKVNRFLFWRSYPKVKEGSTITVPYKKDNTQREKGEKKEIDWGEVLKNSIAQATGILSLLLLVRSLD